MDLTPKAGEEGQIKATWMGHAAFLLEFPSQGGQRGIRILCDPAFSDRCSPVQWAGGRKRYTREFAMVCSAGCLLKQSSAAMQDGGPARDRYHRVWILCSRCQAHLGSAFPTITTTTST